MKAINISSIMTIAMALSALVSTHALAQNRKEEIRNAENNAIATVASSAGLIVGGFQTMRAENLISIYKAKESYAQSTLAKHLSALEKLEKEREKVLASLTQNKNAFKALPTQSQRIVDIERLEKQLGELDSEIAKKTKKIVSSSQWYAQEGATLKGELEAAKKLSNRGLALAAVSSAALVAQMVEVFQTKPGALPTSVEGNAVSYVRTSAEDMVKYIATNTEKSHSHISAAQMAK